MVWDGWRLLLAAAGIGTSCCGTCALDAADEFRFEINGTLGFVNGNDKENGYGIYW